MEQWTWLNFEAARGMISSKKSLKEEWANLLQISSKMGQTLSLNLVSLCLKMEHVDTIRNPIDGWGFPAVLKSIPAIYVTMRLKIIIAIGQKPSFVAFVQKNNQPNLRFAPIAASKYRRSNMVNFGTREKDAEKKLWWAQRIVRSIREV